MVQAAKTSGDLASGKVEVRNRKLRKVDLRQGPPTQRTHRPGSQEWLYQPTAEHRFRTALKMVAASDEDAPKDRRHLLLGALAFIITGAVVGVVFALV